MKKNERPVPLRGIVCLPRWLMISGVALSGACIAFGVGLVVHAALPAEGSGEVAGAIGGAIGCIVGGAGGLFGTLCDWRRRLPATVYLRHVQHDAPHPMWRWFRPALALLAAALLVAALFDQWTLCYPVIQLSGIMAFLAGTIEAIRRHSTRRARAVFALYADGLLEPHDTAAIDATRAQDPTFDADVRAYLQISQQVDDLLLAGLD